MQSKASTFFYYSTTILTLLATCIIKNGLAQFVESFNDYKHNQLDDKLHYNYRYHITDEKRGLFALHSEERQGQRVLGQYALLEPDGETVRSVYYEVDGPKGFRSIVRTHSATSNVHQVLQVSHNQPNIAIIHAEPVAFVT